MLETQDYHNNQVMENLKRRYVKEPTAYCGAAWQERWLQWQRPPRWRPISIAAKEMAPVVLAVATWGACWRGRVVRVLCDNSAVVFAINAISFFWKALNLINVFLLTCSRALHCGGSKGDTHSCQISLEKGDIQRHQTATFTNDKLSAFKTHRNICQLKLHLYIITVQ